MLAWLWRWWRGRRGGLTHLRVVMYTRQGCHLCADAWALLEGEQERYGFALAAGATGAGSAAATGAGSGGGAAGAGWGRGGGVCLAASSALSSAKVRSGAFPSSAACVNFGFGGSRRGLRGGGAGLGGWAPGLA